ncbi:hypothetical protein BDBG_16658 [Blastomyces gilchristii SLH14081]|uniref:Uncharacterized protein n=1 Tax=Blastomyces gilchristii (strain SLH14081) TaxID=559298 RepID=A0A179UF91_BLAGS|nr:uncharacterized protein BDBG_16658 [Blastomyces gilchristii SLH14081]OAT06634.1 hypothetical protein BDBG_16658 [Blastomyces gilchristii SLH14081]
MVTSFNKRVEIGIPRSADAIILPEEMEMYLNAPKIYGTVPECPKKVEPLEEVLKMAKCLNHLRTQEQVGNCKKRVFYVGSHISTSYKPTERAFYILYVRDMCTNMYVIFLMKRITMLVL